MSNHLPPLTQALKKITKQVQILLGSYYEQIFHIDFDEYEDPITLEKKLCSFGIQNHVKEKYKKTAIIIDHGEPLYYVPGSLCPLQYLNLQHALQNAKIFSTDIILLSHGTTAEKIFVEKYVHKELSSNTFKIVELGLDVLRTTILTNAQDVSSNLDQCKFPLSAMFFHHRFHRQLLAKFLLSKKMHKNNMISINSHETNRLDTYDEGTHPYSEQKTITAHQLEKNYVLHQQFTSDDWILDKNLQSLYDNVSVETFKHRMIDDEFEGYYHHFLQRSYVNIVNETVYNYKLPKLTEKIVYPILIKRPFILIGSTGSLQYLRSMGFKTFNNVIDESYDSEPDPNKRMGMIFEQIEKISNMDEAQLNRIVKDTEWICEHNHNLFCDPSIKDSFKIKVKKSVE